MVKLFIHYFIILLFIHFNFVKSNLNNCYKLNDKNETFKLTWNEQFSENVLNENNWEVNNENYNCSGLFFVS